MHDAYLFRVGGGLASVLTGLLLFSAHLINYLNGAENGTVMGKSLVFTAHILAVFALIAIYEAQGKENKLLGLLGMVLSIIGTIIVSAVVLVEMAGASGVNVTPVLNEPVPKIISTFGPLLFVIGMLCLGAAIINVQKIPRSGGWLFIIGTIIFSLGSFTPDLTALLSVIGAALTCVGFLIVGVSLLKRKEGTELFIKRSL